MIVQYKLQLAQLDNTPIPSFWAYRLYAWLLAQLPEDAAERFHEEEKRQLAQYLNHEQIWTVNLFGEEAAELLGQVLENTEQIELHSNRILVLEQHRRVIEKPEELLRCGREIAAKKTEMRFVSPASFKQSGRYTIFPQEKLILQSLLTKWNALYPKYLLDDADMLAEMEKGIHIVDYRLCTSRFLLKNTAIPCFYGKVILEARLPIVLQELWGALLYLAPYSGIGIKTTLGMGGIEL